MVVVGVGPGRSLKHSLGLSERVCQVSPVQAVRWGRCVCVTGESHGMGRKNVF